VSLFVTLKTGKVKKYETGNVAMSSDNGHMLVILTGAPVSAIAFIPMVMVECVEAEETAQPVDHGNVHPFVIPAQPVAEAVPDEPPPVSAA
jgi:hypothetical protein